MKPALTLAVLALSLLPTLAAAAGCDKSGQSAASCVPGMVWDTEKGTCVENPTS